MFNQKPTIALRKEDETAFINIRTYWEVTAHIGRGSDERCYELRVKHAYPEDEFTFVHINRAEHDDEELVTNEEFENRRNAIAENEPLECDRHSEMTEDERDAEIDRLAEKVALPPSGEFAWLCPECKAASLNKADAILSCKPVRAMNKTEEKVLAELRRHWDAFVLLFNPAINTF